MFLCTDDDIMRVVGPAPMGGDFVEIVLEDGPLRQAMLRFSRNILLLSLVISASPRRWSISRCIICSCGRCAASPPT